MNIRSVAPFILAFPLVIASSAWCYAAENEHLKFVYERTTAVPDNVFFDKFLQIAIKDGNEHARLHSILDVQSNMKIPSPEESEAFLDYLLEIRDEIANKSMANKREKLCSTASARPEGLEVYRQLDAVDDDRDSLSQRYLADIREYLSQESFNNFQAWMNDIKRQSVVGRYNHAKALASAQPESVRLRVCRKLESTKTGE